MDHRTSSEASNQNCLRISPGSSVSDVSQQTMCVHRQRTSDPCPGSQPDNPERIYVLRNCDRCPDYTVSPCRENQCPSCSTNCPAQERLSGEKATPTPKSKPPKPAPKPHRKQRPKRRAGGTTEICPLCGQLEILEPGQTMCPHCNQRIHTAVNNYLQCHCYPSEKEATSAQPANAQPANGQQVKLLSGDPNLNVIVLQDCQNKQELFDQLAKAMNRNGGQVQNPQPPCCQGNGYNQSNANNCQGNRCGYQNNPLPCYCNQGNGYNLNNGNYGQSNRSNNPLPGYSDYGNYNKDYEQPEGYDYRYDMDPGQGPKRRSDFYPDTYDDDDRYAIDSPMREAQDAYPEPGYDNDFHDQKQDGGGLCTCNCEFCRQGFETKEKLAMLLAQALEIFVQGHQAGKNKKPKKKKKKKKKQTEKRKAAGSTDAMSEDTPCQRTVSPKQSKPWRTAPVKPFYRPYYPRKRAPPQMHALSQAQGQVHYPTGRMTNSTGETSSQANLSSFCSKHQAPKDPSLRSEDGSRQRGSRPPTFYLPHCEEQRSAHDPGSDSVLGGGGDSRRRRRARRRARYQIRQQQQAEGNQDNQRNGEDRHRWSGGGNDSASADQNRTSGGGKNASVLFGLSPIAHYRPGMMKFPVNYLLAGTNYRRSLVRTAAGVTLHQKPYMDKAEVKDLPHFPRQASSHLDCRMPPPAKKWL